MLLDVVPDRVLEVEPPRVELRAAASPELVSPLTRLTSKSAAAEEFPASLAAYNQGMDFLIPNKCDLLAARTAFQTVIERNEFKFGRMIIALAKISKTFRDSASFVEAEQYFRTLTDRADLDPRVQAAAQLNVAGFLMKQSKPEQALQELEQVLLRADPGDNSQNFSHALEGSLRILRELKKTSGPIIHKERLIRVTEIHFSKPTLSANTKTSLQDKLAALYLEVGRESEALNLIQQIAENPKNTANFRIDQYLRLAAHSRRQENPDAALTAAQNALTLDSNNVRALTFMGVLFRDKGELELASEALRDATSQSNNAESALLYAAVLCEQNKELEASQLLINMQRRREKLHTPSLELLKCIAEEGVNLKEYRQLLTQMLACEMLAADQVAFFLSTSNQHGTESTKQKAAAIFSNSNWLFNTPEIITAIDTKALKTSFKGQRLNEQ